MSHSKRYDQVEVGDTIIHGRAEHTVTEVGWDKNKQVRIEWETGWCAADKTTHIQYVPTIESE